MATLLLKKSYQLSNLKEVTFKDLWGSRGVFTTIRMIGKPPKLILLKPHIENLIKSTKKYGIKQVKLWRRSFDVSPPKINTSHPYINKIFSDIPKNHIPNGEYLKDKINRDVPNYIKEIEPLLQNKKKELLSEPQVSQEKKRI